uniref:Apyrase n=1 Tax=Caenorhabditis japonica TaxID=281687 RepID=A0A8R1EDE9_CAEJA
MFVYTLRPKYGGLTAIDTLVHLNEPIVKKVSPGLSTFADRPDEVIEYITPLLRFAEEHIPANKISETNLFIFATAGMRLLPELKQRKIIENLQTGLRSVTSLRIIDSNIRVIDGAWEGIYSWIAVNYILGRFSREDKPTVGMIDMGGASVQIAFEMPKTEDFVSKDVFAINLGPDGSQNDFNYKIYSTTFLGYGANEGLKKYEASLVSRGESEDSCAPKGHSKTIGGVAVKGSGQWDKCLTRLSSLIDDKTEPMCEEQTCFLGYVPAPTLNLSTVQLYGFSEYWYTTSSFGAGGEYDFEKFTSEVRKFCGKDWVDIQKFLQSTTVVGDIFNSDSIWTAVHPLTQHLYDEFKRYSNCKRNMGFLEEPRFIRHLHWN